MSTAPLATALTCLRKEAASHAAEDHSDVQLLDAYVATNDQAAFAALVRRHGPIVFGVCRRVLQDVHDAEDAFQAVFLTLARKAAGLRNGEALSCWLHGVSYRIAMSAKRDSIRRRQHESRVAPRSNSPAWEIGWRELQAILDEEVEQLAPTFRAAFVLCCLEGLSKAEAAQRLGTKENTVSSRLARARKQLQERLARRGITLTAVLAALAVSGAGRAAPPLRLVRIATTAASQLGAEAPVTGLSARVLSLAEGVTTTMLSTKVKLATVLFLLAALGTGLGTFARPAADKPTVAPSGKRSPAPARPKNSKEKLAADLPITGRVIDLQGKPVVGATVAVDSVDAGPPGSFDEMLKNWKKSTEEQDRTAGRLNQRIGNRGEHAKTAADGTFTLPKMGKDRVVTLLISGKGIADTFVAVAMRKGFDPTGAPQGILRLYPPKFTLVAAPDKPITGVVRDEITKKPLAGVRVAGAALGAPLRMGRYLFHAWPTPATTTDKAGRFTLRGLAKARAYILVADPEEGTKHLHCFAWINDTMGFAPQTAIISLPRGVVLSGRVTDAATGAGVQARVFYFPLEQNAFLSRFGYRAPDLPAPWHRGRDTTTDRNGRYKLTVMPGAGVVNFQAYGPGGLTRGYQRARATKQEIDDGIVDRRFGHFRTVGQGGHFNPEFMNAYRIIRPALTDRTATLNVTVRRNDPPKSGKGR